jgi:glyoxylase-like metal-dependent hydrolase (beta-lactamase superfamily II)
MFWKLGSLAAVLVTATLSTGLHAQSSGSGRDLVVRAAQALGGVERIEALRTIRMRGYGHEAYQDGGSEITTEARAPEKMTNISAFERVVDLPNSRTRVRARLSRAFVFAARAMMEGVPINQGLDGSVAFDIARDGAARRLSAEAAARRRMELLAHPIVAVRAALDAGAQVSRPRNEGPFSLTDVTTASGEEFTLAVERTSNLPAFVRWVGPHENLGEATFRADFSAYEPVGGLVVPMSFNTVSDFRDTVQLRLHVDRYVLDGDVGDLAAPAAVLAAANPVPSYTIEASPVVPGVWHLFGNGGANSVLLEFEDHLTLFEVPTNRAWTEALIAKARATVPGKPVTEAIISHHHFDHTGGLRPAIAEGLTIVTQTGNVAWFEELSRRSVTRFPDALSLNPQRIKTRAVDDHLRLSDSKLTVDVYRVISNNHMAHGLMAYIPEHRLLIQGDLFDMNWEVYFWGNTYEDNVAHRNLTVERDVPIHGRVLPYADVLAKLREQRANASALCGRVQAANLSMPGCPLAWDNP